MTARAKKVTISANPNMRIAEPTVAASYFRAVLNLAVSKGAREGVLLARSGVAAGAYEDPDGRVPLAKFLKLMREGKALTGDPAFALHFGEAYEIGELSIVGLIGLSCETVGEAFAQLNRFSRLVVEVDIPGGGDRLSLQPDRDGVWLVDRRDGANEFPEITESSFARMACASRRMGARGILKAVHVTYRDPGYRSEYDRIFQVPITFGSDKNALLLANTDWLTQKLAVQPQYVFGVLSRRAEMLLEQLERSKTFRGRVEAILMPILHTGDATAVRAAAKLGVSVRTMSRRLEAEGASFQRVLDELRHKVAVSYLSDGKASTNETAYLVGFSERSAFHRAFKRWTGMTPRGFLAAKK